MQMKKATKEAFLRMKSNRDRLGQAIYELVKDAAEVLKDRTFIDNVHGGDYEIARDAVASEYFQNLSIPLVHLLTCYEVFPDKGHWAKLNYKVADIWTEAKEEIKSKQAVGEDGDDGNPPKEPPKPRATHKDLKERDERIEELEYKIKYMEKDRTDEKSLLADAYLEIERLKKENEEQQKEISFLSGRIRELEKFQGSAAA